MDEDSFRYLYEEYRNNDYDDEYVACLRCLPEDERNLFFLFIVDNCCYARLARRFHVSAPWLKNKIDSIRQKIVDEHKRQEGESEYYLKVKPKQEDERKVVQIEQFSTNVIGVYGIDEAARNVNGSVSCIRDVCNGRTGKYKGYRWAWLNNGKIYNGCFISTF